MPWASAHGAADWARCGNSNCSPPAGSRSRATATASPWGLAGGGQGYPATLRLLSGNAAQELPSKMPYRRMQSGDRFLCVGPSGGGYGAPMARTPEAVRQDVLDGLLDRDAAARDFGVVLTGANEIDPGATARLREGH